MVDWNMVASESVSTAGSMVAKNADVFIGVILAVSCACALFRLGRAAVNKFLPWICYR